MAENKETHVALTQNVGEQVIKRVNNLCEAGFTVPKDYNYVNAIKMSMLKLQELKDRNGKGVFEVCTPNSIQTALFKMCCRGLNIAFNQAYPIIRGNQLCIDDSYFGKVLMVKRIFPEWEPKPHVVREGDEFVYTIIPETGKTKLVKHVQKLENIDNGFVGGYIYLPCKDGDMDLYIMTKKQIMTAWSKSSSREMQTHKAFDEKMVGKTLVNSGCNMIINSTPEYQVATEDEEQVQHDGVEDAEFTEMEEYVESKDVVDTTTGEIEHKDTKKVAAKDRTEVADDSF